MSTKFYLDPSNYNGLIGKVSTLSVLSRIQSQVAALSWLLLILLDPFIDVSKQGITV